MTLDVDTVYVAIVVARTAQMLGIYASMMVASMLLFATISALHGSHTLATMAADRWKMVRCNLAWINGVRRSAFGHNYRVVRRREEWISPMTPAYEGDGTYVISRCGLHVVCRTCGEQYDWTDLGELSPLEQLALCAN